MSDFGQRLKLIRKKRKITQKELAEALNVGQSTIANYENNTRFPGELPLRQLSDYLKVSVDYLLGTQVENQNQASSIKVNTPSQAQYSWTLIRKELLTDLLAGEESLATSKLMSIFKAENNTLMLIEKLYIPILNQVGRLWASGEVSIAQEHFVSNVIDRWLAMTSSRPSATSKSHSVLFMVPSGEQHVLVLKMIREYFRTFGWKTYYIGNSVPVSSLSGFIESLDIDLVVLSISIKTHLNNAEHLIHALKGLSIPKVPEILIGGKGISDSKEALELLGADYYVRNITEINDLITQLELKLN
jgi:transcriptional regulator with XRE-family HTH domain/methylmalonyl-CoA mutase cobalamin-binding subunit